MKENRYAQVIVNISVSRVDQVFNYAVPLKLKEKIQLGHAVLVPFGRRKVSGYIVGFTSEPEVELDKIKEIESLVSDEVFFDRQMIELLKWMADYYRSNFNKLINTAVPTGVVQGRVNKKIKNKVKLAQSSAETIAVINSLKKRAPKQAAVLQILVDENGQIKYSRKKLADKADTSPGTVSRLIEKGYLEEYQLIADRRPYLEAKEKDRVAFKPSRAQARAIEMIGKHIRVNQAQTFLLHGVTGSGKTEVYLQVIRSALDSGKGAIVLVPEISLTPMMVSRFYSRFGDLVAVLHSNLSLGERYDEWRRLKRGEARIAIGARSAVFAPVENLGLIIIDEEHENSYKQGEYPYYHARDVAIKRGKICKAPVVLGSATPSLESFYLADRGYHHYLSLPERVKTASMPPVEVVDMRDELRQGNLSIFSASLQRAIEKSLARKEQVLIFLNRRGYANFVLCRDCGAVIKCRNCDISLTYHAGEKRLRCHYCDYSAELPAVCPSCGSRLIKDFGIGTEKIEEEVRKLYPGANVDRMDVDTTGRKGSYRKILQRLELGQTDILVGTQMIAKGHDYPNISVVGVITADTILNLPDFRAGERTFQLLTQVAGRTGRGEKTGKVIIQTYSPDHYSIKAAREHDYQFFYRHELPLRKKINYPPFARLVNIIIKGSKEDEVIKTAQLLAASLEKYRSLIQELLGPGPAPIGRIKNMFRWQIILKFSKHKAREQVLSMLDEKVIPGINTDISINIDVDPQSML